jgi:hypothetical protein
MQSSSMIISIRFPFLQCGVLSQFVQSEVIFKFWFSQYMSPVAW